MDKVTTYTTRRGEEQVAGKQLQNATNTTRDTPAEKGGDYNA